MDEQDAIGASRGGSRGRRRRPGSRGRRNNRSAGDDGGTLGDSEFETVDWEAEKAAAIERAVVSE